MPGSSGLGSRSSRFLVNSEWRSTVIFSISWRARTQVSSVDLMAPSSAEASAVSRARSAAIAGASGGASLPGGGPELLDLRLDGGELRPQLLCGVARSSARMSSTSMRSRPSSSSSSVSCCRAFSAVSMAAVSLAMAAGDLGGSGGSALAGGAGVRCRRRLRGLPACDWAGRMRCQQRQAGQQRRPGLPELARLCAEWCAGRSRAAGGGRARRHAAAAPSELPLTAAPGDRGGRRAHSLTAWPKLRGWRVNTGGRGLLVLDARRHRSCCGAR